MLKGEACKKTVDSNGQIKYNAMTSQAIFRKCRVLPAYIEIPICCLLMLQRWIRDKENNQWILTIFFNPRFEFENRSYTYDETRIDMMHPWARQMYKHLLLVGNIEKGREVLDSLSGDFHT